MSEKTEGRIEITIWFFSIVCGIAVAIYAIVHGATISKALIFGLLGVIAFMGVALLIYLIIHSKITLGKDDK